MSLVENRLRSASLRDSCGCRGYAWFARYADGGGLTAEGRVVLVRDDLSTHRGKKMRQFAGAGSDWLTMVRLPGCAPGLNAVEGGRGTRRWAGVWARRCSRGGIPRRPYD